MFKALSNPKRLELFCRLVQACGPQTCCCTSDELSLCVQRLAGQLQLAVSTISHHLRALQAAGLIDVARQGKFNAFKIHAAALAALVDLLGVEILQTQAPQRKHSRVSQ